MKKFEEETRHPEFAKFMRPFENPTIRVSEDAQAVIPKLEPRATPRRVFAPNWNPECVKEGYQQEFVEKLESFIGYRDICDEKATKLLQRYQLDADMAMLNVGKNKTYYKNLLSAETRKYVKELKKIN